MLSQLPPEARRTIGRIISAVSILGALFTGLIVIRQIIVNPRTDDAEVFANYIGMAPLVNGPILHLYVADNQYVKQGQLMVVVDPRPYAYALQLAKSELGELKGNIVDESRRIASASSAVSVAKAGVKSAINNLAHAVSAVQEAEAEVGNAKAQVLRNRAELKYASDNLNRIQPLLAKEFVTVDQVDRAQTLVASREQAFKAAIAQQALAEAHLTSSLALKQQAEATLKQSRAQVKQASNAVLTLEPLLAQRSGKVAAIETARYYLDNCRIYAPFNGHVTNLTISKGEYAHAGQQIFTMIDTRTWWVLANFRETQLADIRPGMKADVYIMSRPGLRLHGVVDSVGYGVTPDLDIIGKLTKGLPDVQRTLNWVHLASRFPVRIRILNGPKQDFRLGESAVVVVHGASGLFQDMR